jgi:predicted O-linked N-acetylglucosamine transferase (SPINDLY family)
MQHLRRELEENVDQMIADQLKIDVTSASAPTNFYSAYQGLNDRDLQMKLARLLDAPSPKLRSLPRNDRRIRIGFISRHFRNHTIGRLNLGTIRHLPRDQFEITVISVGAYDDAFSHAFRDAADHYVVLPTNLQAIRNQVAELNLDILYFADVGMDTLTYTLSMSRMAPVQCVSWGHPVTTGSPVMDYFVSSKNLEVPDADSHYSEKLARFDRLNVYYYRPAMPEPRDASYFGLDPNRNIYLCFQNVFKLHPDFDQILAGILDRDPLAEIVMMEGRHPEWTDLLRRRFDGTLGANANRIRFLGSQSHPDFMSLNALARVSLDPLHFGGGNTTYEALAVGLPVVTCPSRFLRGRISYAMYQQMGMDELVVQNSIEYIDLAVRLGTDHDFRREIHEKILGRCSVLFEDQQAIDEYVKFFETVHQSQAND